MIYLNKTLDKLELDLESLDAMIHIMEAGDYKTYLSICEERETLARIIHNAKAIISGNGIDLVIDNESLNAKL